MHPQTDGSVAVCPGLVTLTLMVVSVDTFSLSPSLSECTLSGE